MLPIESIVLKIEHHYFWRL